MIKPEPFFRRDGHTYVPTDASLGYWVPRTLDGRVIGALLGFELERTFGEDALVPARFTVDLFRLSPRAPVRIVTRLVKSGGRLRVAEAEFVCEDALIARASCVFVRASQSPAHPTWQSPNWKAPPPLMLPPDSRFSKWEIRPIGPEHQPFVRAWAANAPAPLDDSSPLPGSNPPVLGVMAPIEARQAWVRETRELVEGFEHTAFTRLAAAADFASPLANSSEIGIDFVNCDFTTYVHRLPKGEWIGFELVRHQACQGVAIGECWLHDEAGPIGTVNVTAIAQRQRTP